MARLSLGRESGAPQRGIVRHRLATSFRAFQASPFEEQREGSYATWRERRRFRVEIRKTNLFSWSLIPGRRYRDLVLVAELDFDASNGHGAAGFILRYLDQGSFYYFLISNRGSYRFDLVLNGNYLPLIEWTRSPLVSGGANHLRIVSRGAYFGFCLEEELVAEIEDDRLEVGLVGLAAQNFDESERAGFSLRSFTLDSTPREVERSYERWSHALEADPEARVRLAQTLASMGRTEAAIVQLNKARKARRLSPEESCLLARLYMSSKLYVRALEAVDAALASAPEHAEALVEKAEILYALDRQPECRELAASLIVRGVGGAAVAMILGNAEYALGNWRAAADAYRGAWERERAPLAALNAARGLDRLGEADRALELYVAAAEAYHRRGSLDEVELILAELGRSRAQRPEVRSLRARVLFARGAVEEAGRELERLIAEGVEDSAVHFLHGLLLARSSRRVEALRHFERAVELEPDVGPYWFRLAETRHLLQQDARPALEEALRRSPGDPWSTNLLGQLLAEEGDLEAAEEALSSAAEAAPDAPEILINLSDVLRRRGRTAEALELLEEASRRMPERPELVNQRGNILAASGEVEEAQEAYEKALAMDPRNPDYLENCARASIEGDLVLRAEECLRRLLELRPSASAYNLMGNVAAIQRQYERAEAAFSEGLKLSGSDPDLLYNLAVLRITRGDELGAEQTLARLEASAAGRPELEAKAGRARAQHRSRFQESLRCSSCAREWWVSRNLPPQPPVRARGDPPDEAPVGACPQCGRVYCARCARECVVDARFVCPSCMVPLRLTDQRLVYLFRASLSDAEAAAP